LVKAGFDGEEEARMVIEDGEGVDALAVDFEPALEIALPKFVGVSAFETKAGVGRSREGMNALVSGEDVGDGADAGEARVGSAEEGVNFARAPTEEVADLEDGEFEIIGGASRGESRTRGEIYEGAIGSQGVASEPFVAGFATDAKETASSGNGGAQGANLMDEGEADFGHGNNLPGHGTPPW